MATTLKPTGITIVRDGNLKFVVTWKIADKDYGAGHQFRYRIWTSEKKYSAWTESTASSTSKTITLTASDYYPTTSKKIYYFEVEIRGKRNNTTSQGRTTTYDWSAWSGKKLKISEPHKPTMSTELTSSNKTVFTWNTSTDSKDTRPLVNTRYQTILVKESKETDGSKLKWKTSNSGWGTGTGSANDSLTKTEDTTILAKNSYTRWVRVRSQGAHGFSAWRYAKHVYARPNAAKIKEAKATVKNSNTTLYVKWTAASDAAHPIDETTTEYYIGTPGAGMSFPTGQTGTEGSSSIDTKSTDAASYVISSAVGLDECLFVRVVTHHDANVAASAWKIPEGGKGGLKAPTAMTVTYDDSTNIAAVTALTKGTTVPDAQHAVVYRGSNGKNVIVGIIASNASTLSNIKCPAGTASPSFGIFAFQGTATEKSSTGSVKIYSISENMRSATLWQGGTVPSSPANFTADRTETTGEVMLTWDWSWADANKAELSWSTNPNAWESTDEPSTYIVDGIRNAQWRVSGLAVGRTWYFQIRLLQESSDSTIYGPYAEQKAVNLSTAPAVPVLSLSNAVIPVGGKLTAAWEYAPTDGTQQVYASICTATIDDTATPPITYGSEVAHAETAQHADIDTSNWISGTTYNLCVRVTSASGEDSTWSDPVPVYVAEPISIAITENSLDEQTVDGVAGLYLTELPMTITIEGAGAGGTTTLVIERAQDYSMSRPDDSRKDGYDGETIVLFSQTGEAQITVTRDMLIGTFDDGAMYRLIAAVEDGFGQGDSLPIEFGVHWDDQAVVPEATVELVGTVAKLTPAAGTGTPAGSTCDIYRLSVDSPQLIVQGGTFGTAYVDPFPTLGENAGYRFVCMTANGDYINGTDQPAWYDVTGQLLDNKNGIINFNGEALPIQFNVGLTASWKKDFKETKYLGGTVRGDWNPAVSRTASVTVTIPTEDTESIQKMRRLANWNGICHVRTQDGSSYSADVQVSGNTGYSVAGKVETFTLNITRIEPEALDGIPYSEWVTA